MLPGLMSLNFRHSDGRARIWRNQNENTVEHHWTFCRPAYKVED